MTVYGSIAQRLRSLDLRLLATTVALAVLFVWIRGLFIQADPPVALPGGYPLRELLVEPVAKASEARNWAIFGVWTPNPSDEYQFWRPQSPVWVYPLAGFFQIFGVGYAELRAFAIIAGLLGYFALLAIARLRLQGVELVAAALFPALDALHVLYSRSGLLEPAVNSWLSLAILCLLLARRHWAWLLGAQWAFVLAFFTKAAATYAFPLIVASSAWLLLLAPGASNVARARAIVIAHAAVLAAVSLTYILSDFYWRTVIWNFNHVVLDRDHEEELLTHSVSLQGLWANLTSPEKLRNLGWTVPITGPVALLEAGAVLFGLVRRRPVDYWRVLISGWVISALLVLLFIGSTPLRFMTILVAPCALGAASGLASISGWFRATRPYVHVAVLVAFTLFNGWMFRTLASGRSYEVRKATRALEAAVGSRRAAIGGFYSAPVVFGTRYEHYYVKEHFNVSHEAIERLRLTDLLIVSNYDIFQQRFPGWRRGLSPRFSLPMMGKNLRHYALPEPLSRAYLTKRR